MIDMEWIDKLYEVHRSGRIHVNLETFDKRRLLPLEALACMVAAEDGQPMSPEGFEELAARGWFQIGETENGNRGAPAYVPERIELLREVARKGYRDLELARWVRWEEYFIEEILTGDDDVAYIDDDLDLILSQIRSTIEAKEHGKAYDAKGNLIDTTEEISKLKRALDWYESLRGRDLSERERDWIEKTAFQTRSVREATRALLIEHERAEFRAGYSAGVSLASTGFTIRDGNLEIEAGDIMWPSTVQSALAQAEEDGGPTLIRIPKFLIEEDRVVPVQTMIPSEYERAWRAANLDGFLEEWARIRGDRRCQHCFAALPADADQRRLYCGERCRGAAKQRRWRKQNPLAFQEAQRRYFNSLPDFEVG